MIRWQSWKLWFLVLMVCVISGVMIGVIFSKKHKRPTVLNQLSNESCKQLLDRPVDISFALNGLLVKKNNNNVLLKFNDQESMWVSLREGYKVIDNKNRGVEMSLDAVEIGSKVMVTSIGLTDRLDNILYADKLEIE